MSQPSPTWPTFSLLFFASAPAEFERDKFDLFRQSTRFADERGFEAVWIPERHFHAFGGMFPNPGLTGGRRAGEGGCGGVWIPGRHFHAFGGVFPNPAVSGVVLGETTRRIRIRAGSV